MSSKLLHLDLNPDERTLKQFGFIALAGFGVLAVCAFYERGMFAVGLGSLRAPVAYVLAGLGCLAGAFSVLRPRANRAIYLGLTLLTYPIGLVVSYVVLGLLFFGVFAPIGVVLRAIGADPMQRALRKGERTYWSDAREKRDTESYFRQF